MAVGHAITAANISGNPVEFERQETWFAMTGDTSAGTGQSAQECIQRAYACSLVAVKKRVHAGRGAQGGHETHDGSGKAAVNVCARLAHRVPRGTHARRSCGIPIDSAAQLLERIGHQACVTRIQSSVDHTLIRTLSGQNECTIGQRF